MLNRGSKKLKKCNTVFFYKQNSCFKTSIKQSLVLLFILLAPFLSFVVFICLIILLIRTSIILFDLIENHNRLVVCCFNLGFYFIFFFLLSLIFLLNFPSSAEIIQWKIFLLFFRPMRIQINVPIIFDNMNYFLSLLFHFFFNLWLLSLLCSIPWHLIDLLCIIDGLRCLLKLISYHICSLLKANSN